MSRSKDKKNADPAIGDPVTHAELQEELQRLRSAVTLLANCCGAHIIDQGSARKLMALLAPPYERHLHELGDRHD